MKWKKLLGKVPMQLWEKLFINLMDKLLQLKFIKKKDYMIPPELEVSLKKYKF